MNINFVEIIRPIIWFENTSSRCNIPGLASETIARANSEFPKETTAHNVLSIEI